MYAVKSLTSMYRDKPGTNLVHTSMYEGKPGTYWYTPVCTQKKEKWLMCMPLGFEPRISYIPSCVLYHYATSVTHR